MISRLHSLAPAFTRFAGAGALGFAVDASVLSLLVHGMGWSALHARLVSMTLAITTTWIVNRRYALKPSRALPSYVEYVGYFAIQLSGAALNFGVFVVCLKIWPALARVPVVPLAVGAAVAMFFNFAVALSTLYSARGAR